MEAFSDTATGSVSFFIPISTSRYLKVSQADLNAVGVLLSPMPMTNIRLSRRRAASRVKSESELTMQNPSTFFVYRISIASMIMAESDAFLPCV